MMKLFLMLRSCHARASSIGVGHPEECVKSISLTFSLDAGDYIPDWFPIPGSLDGTKSLGCPFDDIDLTFSDLSTKVSQSFGFFSVPVLACRHLT